MGAQNSSNSSNCLDCCGPKIISQNDLKKTSLSLNKNNKHVVEALQKEKKISNNNFKENNTSKTLEMNNKFDKSSKPYLNNDPSKLEKSTKMTESQAMNNSIMEKSGFHKKLNIEDFIFIRVFDDHISYLTLIFIDRY